MGKGRIINYKLTNKNMKTIEISEETFEKIKDQLGDEVLEVENLDDLIGKKMLFQCARYIYYGKVKTINSAYIELEKAGIVYETGELKATSVSDFQELPSNVFVMRNAIESFWKPKW